MNRSTIPISLNLEHSYVEQLQGFSVSALPAPVREPTLLQFNQTLASELGLDIEKLTSEVATQIFSGNELPLDAQPVAQAYAGHQFGGFVPQLGDGRALLLGELIDRQGVRRDIALKGSGRTPFSRGGDGKAAVGPVLREYLISEAMHAMGIPTTRALAAVATGETVMRHQALPGAVLTRVAASHIRVGTFEYFAARGQVDQIRKLADYVIMRHYPETAGKSQRYLSLLQCTVERQAALIASWMLVGFIHGVMNTDNMAISGETIDYGPCAFMDSYDPKTVFSSIDHHGRYAYVNQPTIALWNLARFAETLLPLLDQNDSERTAADATAILNTFVPTFEKHWYEGALTKLGLAKTINSGGNNAPDRMLVDDWFECLRKNKVDYILSWRRLADAAEGNEDELRSFFTDQSEFDDWMERWKQFQLGAPSNQVASAIRAASPIHIPRNHLVEEALAAATNGDLTPFESLLEVVQKPFDENCGSARYSQPASSQFTAKFRTFCGT